MRHLWNLVWNRAGCAISAIILGVLVLMFFWKLINPEAYANTMQGFLNDIWEIAKFIIGLLIIYFAFRLIFRGVFGGNNRQRHH